MRSPADSINKYLSFFKLIQNIKLRCIKNSDLYHNGTIEPRFLTINERVRQFGGHPSYARFLMFMGLGLLSRRKKTLYFKCHKKHDLINIPKSLGGVELVKDFDGNTKFTNIFRNFSYYMRFGRFH